MFSNLILQLIYVNASENKLVFPAPFKGTPKIGLERLFFRVYFRLILHPTGRFVKNQRLTTVPGIVFHES